MKFKVNNQETVLVTENQKLLDVLNRKYKRKVPGARYSKKYRKGFWDGKISFVDKNGKFGTGLLSHIEADLKLVDIDYEIEDERDMFEFQEPEVEGLTLRDYQQDLVSAALIERRCIIQAPTAAGKTPILAYLLSAIGEGRKGVIFFTKKSILVQTYEFLVKFGFDVGMCCGEGFIFKDVMLCTAQSVHKIVDTHLDSEFIMFDEVHEFANGKIGKALLTSFSNASVRIGLSATVPKEDIPRLTLISGLGMVIEDVTAKQLVDEGWLAEPNITMLEMEYPEETMREKMAYEDYYYEYIINYPVRNKMILDTVRNIQKEDHSKTLILVKNLEHAEILKSIIPGSIVVQGKDSLSIRDKSIKGFVKEDHGVIIGTVVFQTGVNIPEITHFINARALKSEIATIQAMGRALRLHESKDTVEIIDFLDEVKYLEKHARKRLSAYKRLGFKVNKDGQQFRKSKESLKL